jgi:hypothetical protein
MLLYPDCQVPDEYSAVKVPTRPSSRCPSVFATISAEPTFEEMTPRDIVWAPSGMAGGNGGNVGFDNATDDVELPPEKDSGRRHGGVQKSKAALPSIPRKSIPAGQIKPKAQFASDSVLDPSPAPATDTCPSLDSSAPVPARIAAMNELSRNFFQHWRLDALSRGQACHPHTRVRLTRSGNALTYSRAQVSAHMSDDEVIAAFSKETG